MTPWPGAGAGRLRAHTFFLPSPFPCSARHRFHQPTNNNEILEMILRFGFNQRLSSLARQAMDDEPQLDLNFSHKNSNFDFQCRAAKLRMASSKPRFVAVNPTFDPESYRTTLKNQYGRLISLSSKVIGAPSAREVAIVEKIEALERRLEEEAMLVSPRWDPIRDPLPRREARRRDGEVQASFQRCNPLSA